MNSPTRFSIDSQLARIQIGIRKTVSMISIRAMPSMPSAQAKRPKIWAYSVNLPFRGAGRLVERGPDDDAEQQVDERGAERDPARLPGRGIEAGNRAEHGHGEHQRQDREVKLVHFGMIAQVAAAARPISITSA